RAVVWVAECAWVRSPNIRTPIAATNTMVGRHVRRIPFLLFRRGAGLCRSKRTLADSGPTRAPQATTGSSARPALWAESHLAMDGVCAKLSKVSLFEITSSEPLMAPALVAALDGWVDAGG